MKIDWRNPEYQITEHFKVKEATTMGGEFFVVKYKEIQENIIKTAEMMELIRDRFNLPIIVHSWYRTHQHNKLIGGAKKSMHLKGLACDFHIKPRGCDSVRARLLPYLECFKIRMEDNPGSKWIHIDLKQFNRFFKP